MSLFWAVYSSAAMIRSLEVMFYNVENLFDTSHDNGKDDWTFVPKKNKNKQNACDRIKNPYYRRLCNEVDWKPEKLEIKMNQIGDVVKNGRNNIPDVLALCEVENENVVRMLAKKIGYEKIIVADGPDRRGIDVALMYRELPGMKFVYKKEHVLKGGYFKKKPTRTILEVEFLINKNQSVTFLVNHWPSQANPSEVRKIAAQKVIEIVKEKTKKNSKHNFIVLGDFNTIPEDHPHPFKDVIFKSGLLKDVHNEYMRSKKITKAQKKTIPLGTFFYYRNMTWNLLDRIFVSNNLMKKKKGMYVELPSYEIYTPDFIIRDYVYDNSSFHRGTKVTGVPKDYNFTATSRHGAGYSDHFPVVVRFNFKNQK